MRVDIILTFFFFTKISILYVFLNFFRSITTTWAVCHSTTKSCQTSGILFECSLYMENHGQSNSSMMALYWFLITMLFLSVIIHWTFYNCSRREPCRFPCFHLKMENYFICPFKSVCTLVHVISLSVILYGVYVSVQCTCNLECTQVSIGCCLHPVNCILFITRK